MFWTFGILVHFVVVKTVKSLVCTQFSLWSFVFIKFRLVLFCLSLLFPLFLDENSLMWLLAILIDHDRDEYLPCQLVVN